MEVKTGNLEISYRYTSEISERVGTSYGQASGSWVYEVYLEYRVHELQDGMVLGVGKFNRFECSQYERKLLMDQEDLKLQFNRWTRKNIKNLCVELSQAFLNKMLKREVGPQVLELHNITLTVCRNTTSRWIHLCGTATRRICQNYYNDLNQDDVVIKYLSEHIDECERLYGRMDVWKLLDKAEEDAFMARIADFPMCKLMKPEFKVCKCYVHHTTAERAGWTTAPCAPTSFRLRRWTRDTSMVTCLRSSSAGASLWRSGRTRLWRTRPTSHWCSGRLTCAAG